MLWDVGLIGVLSVVGEGAAVPTPEGGIDQMPLDGHVDSQLVWSTHPASGWSHADGARTVVIPRGNPGSFDAGMVMGTTREPITTDDEHRWYYTGCSVTHGGPLSQKRMSIGLATWRLHRFLSLDVADDRRCGIVETVTLRLPRGQLELNADVPEQQGRIFVELLDSTTRQTVEGRAAADCNPVCGDSLRHVVQWGTGSLIEAGEYRLVFRMQGRSRLFAFTMVAFAEQVSTTPCRERL